MIVGVSEIICLITSVCEWACVRAGVCVCTFVCARVYVYVYEKEQSTVQWLSIMSAVNSYVPFP